MGRSGKQFVLMTPKKKALINIRRRVREAISSDFHKNTKEIILGVNQIIAGWVNFYRVCHSSKVFSIVRYYVGSEYAAFWQNEPKKRFWFRLETME